ncbi:MAG: VWA domain-containing protein [Verrucomicrobia bacterium]|nr:VWA domain-containing protein [Verrucomicrobiota bacterium]
MTRRLLFALLLLLWLVLAASGARADGFIIIPHPGPVPPGHFPFAPLEVASHRVDVKIDGQIAATTVEQEFVNPNNTSLEGTYIFPVPKGAHIDKFTMEINGRQAEAELLAADKARGIYEEIVRQMKDPALLEYAGRDVFKVRIFPIEPHSHKQVRITYTQLLQSDNGTLTYLYPLATEKFSARSISQVSVKVSLQADAPLGTIYSPSHPVEIRRDREGSERRATVGWEGKNVRPDVDFQLVFATEKSEVGVRVLSFRDPDAGPRGGAEEQGWFLLLAAPSPETRDNKTAPKDVVFVVDTSGSMAGAKMNQAKKALGYCVNSLNPEDRFEIVRFSTEAEGLFNKLADAGEAERKRAAAFIKDLRAAGGTAIADALKAALKIRVSAGSAGSARPFVVVFLTDGQPTVGPTSEDAILDVVRKSGEAAKNTRVFCFGIGNDVNTHLLDQLAEATRAASQYVLPEEDIEVKVSNFFARIREPALTGLRLEVEGGGVRVSQLLPGELPDLFKGDQLVVVGRYRGAGETDVTLTGRGAGREQRFVYHTKFGSADPGAENAETQATREFIPRLWATRRVGFLLDEIRLRGETAVVKEEVVALARKFGIVTPYTAYLILDDEERRRVPESRRLLSQMNKDGAARDTAANAYSDFRQNRAGESAVANAQSQSSLRNAEQAGSSIAAGNARALDASRAAAAAAPAMARRGRGGNGSITTATTAPDAAAQNRLESYTQNARFVNGRAFYQNGRQWVDGNLQNSSQPNASNQTPVRVQFGSAEYFKLLKEHPEAAGWFALGQNVLLAIGDTAYEIYE